MVSQDKKSSVWELLTTYGGGSLKKKFIEIATRELLKGLFSQFPFLGWPVISIVVSFFTTKLMIRIMDKTIVGIHILYIYGDVNLDKRKVQKIIRKIQEARIQGEMSDEQREKFDDELAEAGLELIRFGSGIPKSDSNSL